MTDGSGGSGLRDRARGEVAVRDGGEVQARNPQTLAQKINAMEEQFRLAMPRGVEARQLIRDALTVLRTTPKLAECQPQSVLGGLMTCAQLGLRPGVLGHAWLLPFWDKHSRQFKAQLVIGYQGLVELAHRSGKIASLIARTVHANDHFEVDYGLADDLVHKPAMRGPRGEPVAYYAIVKLTTRGHAFIVMTHDDMTAYRDRYAMARNKQGEIVGPWRDQFEGMAHKTCVRQLAKWMPKSTDLAVALEADESIRFDIDPTADAAAVSVHEDVVDSDAVEVPPVEADVVDQAGEAVAPAEPADPGGDDASDPINRSQLTKLHTVLTGLGYRDRDERLALVVRLVRREMPSTSGLTKAEASTLIDLLEKVAARPDPVAVLEDLLAATEQGRES